MSQIKVRRLKNYPTELAVPGDKSISHRAVMLAGLCEGTTIIENFLPSAECIRSLEAMAALGVQYEVLEADEQGLPVKLAVTGHGMKLRVPETPIDCGSSSTTMELLCGLLAAQPFTSTLTGDEALRRRPMNRITAPLAEMGAKVTGQDEMARPPLTIQGSPLQQVTSVLPGADGEAKSAVLLAGWQAPGKTSVVETLGVRDHTERLLSHFQVKCVRRSCEPEADGHEGSMVSIYGLQRPTAADLRIPGDISNAALWMVAAGASKGARITIPGVGLNPTRTGIIRVLIRMGVKVVDRTEVPDGEPFGNVVIYGGELNGTHIGGAEIPTVMDELPILAVAGALAHGKTTIRNAAELRKRETDRIQCVAHNLRQMGVQVDEFHDGMEITGGARLLGAELVSYGDDRIAMAFAVAGLFAEGVTTISDTDCIDASYPGFEKHLAQFLEMPKDSDHSTHVINRMPPKIGARVSQSQV